MINKIIEELREEKFRLLQRVNKIDVALESLENIDEEEQNSIHKRQTIKPMIIDTDDPKKLRKLKRLYKKQIPKFQKKRKERGKGHPKMMVYFVKQKMNQMKNPELVEAIKEKFDIDISPTNLSKWMWTQKLKRSLIKKVKNNSHTPARSQTGKIIPKKKKLFPEEIDSFIERHWKQNKDTTLRQLIGDKFGIFYNTDQIKQHRRKLRLVADRPGDKESLKESLKETGGVHFNDNGKALCNYKSGEVEVNLSKDWSNVNCGRCEAVKKKIEREDQESGEPEQKSVKELKELYESPEEEIDVIEDVLED